MPRHESICTHDRANEMSDYANTGAASTLPNRSVRARTCNEIVMLVVLKMRGKYDKILLSVINRFYSEIGGIKWQ